MSRTVSLRRRKSGRSARRRALRSRCLSREDARPEANTSLPMESQTRISISICISCCLPWRSAAGIQGTDGYVSGRSSAGHGTSQRLFQGTEQRLSRVGVQNSSQRPVGMRVPISSKIPREPDTDSALKTSIPAEPVRFHARRTGASPEIVQREEPAVLHDEL